MLCMYVLYHLGVLPKFANLNSSRLINSTNIDGQANII